MVTFVPLLGAKVTFASLGMLPSQRARNPGEPTSASLPLPRTSRHTRPRGTMPPNVSLVADGEGAAVRLGAGCGAAAPGIGSTRAGRLSSGQGRWCGGEARRGQPMWRGSDAKADERKPGRRDGRPTLGLVLERDASYITDKVGYEFS